MELKDRERKVDVNKMTPDQVDVLSAQIGEKVRNICDDAANRVNAILNIYGMSAKIAIKFNELPKAMKKSISGTKSKKQPKDANLKKE